FFSGLHGLMVTGRQVCVFGVLIGGDDFRVYRIERDDETIAAIREKEVAFWNRIRALNPPEAVHSSDILKLFDKDSTHSIEVISPVLEAFNRLRAIKNQIAQLETEAVSQEEHIKLFMQDAASLTLEG